MKNLSKNFLLLSAFVSLFTAQPLYSIGFPNFAGFPMTDLVTIAGSAGYVASRVGSVDEKYKKSTKTVTALGVLASAIGHNYYIDHYVLPKLNSKDAHVVRGLRWVYLIGLGALRFSLASSLGAGAVATVEGCKSLSDDKTADERRSRAIESAYCALPGLVLPVLSLKLILG